tara:strand:- start:1150 stop:1599 length:450 start_codon:yes stop_codon:yes gene_type:complete
MMDLANNLIAVQSLAPAVRTADANGTGVDLQGFEGAMAIFDIGAEGDTLSGSVKIDVKLEHSDDDSSYSAVTSSSDVTDGSVDSNGVWATFDDNTEAPAVVGIGYVGGKRYVRVVADFTGSHSNGTPVSAMIVKGFARHSENAGASSTS